MLGGPADTYAAGMKDGIFEAYRPKDSDAIPANLRDPGNYWTGIGVIPLCFLTNTKFLAKNNMKAPSKWADLLDPRYKNNLQMADARTSGTATERIYSLVKVMGEDEAFKFQKKLNGVTITYPEDGVSFGIEATGVIKGGKNNAEAKQFVDWAASKKFAEFIVANKINYVPTRTDVKTSNPILDLSKIHTVQVDTAWKGEKRKEYTQRWINEVIK